MKGDFNAKLVMLRRHESSCEFANGIKKHSPHCVFYSHCDHGEKAGISLCGFIELLFFKLLLKIECV